MTTHEWLLFLHLLAAFVLVSGLVAYSVLVLSSRGEAVSRALGSPALLAGVTALAGYVRATAARPRR